MIVKVKKSFRNSKYGYFSASLEFDVEKISRDTFGYIFKLRKIGKVSKPRFVSEELFDTMFEII